MSDFSLAGVTLRDVYRDSQGDLWEVIALTDQPQASFRRARDGEQVAHVIGCLNMREMFPNPPLRPATSTTTTAERSSPISAPVFSAPKHGSAGQ